MKAMYLSRGYVGGSFFVCLLALSSPSWSYAAEVAKSPHGPTDEIGVLNTLTAAHSLAVLQRIDSGSCRKPPHPVPLPQGERGPIAARRVIHSTCAPNHIPVT